MLVLCLGARITVHGSYGAHTLRTAASTGLDDVREAIDSAPGTEDVVLVTSGTNRQTVLDLTGALAALTEKRYAVWAPSTNNLATALALGHLGDAPAEAPLALAMLSRRVQQTIALTWLPRVNGLRDPAPSITQHVRSWLPGRGYLIHHETGGARVDAVGKGPRIPEDATGPAWYEGPVPASLLEDISRITRRRPQPYPTSNTVTAAETTPRMTAAMVAIEPVNFTPPTAAGVCPSCGQAVPVPSCPFCRTSVPVTQGATP